MNTKSGTLGEIAAAAGIGERSLRRRALLESWPYTRRRVKGGDTKLYPIDGLPEDVRAAILTREMKKQGVGPKPERFHETFAGASEKSKDIAAYRLSCVLGVSALMASGCGPHEARRRISEESGESPTTLYRWCCAVKSVPENKWLLVLAPAYQGRKKTAEFSDEAWEHFKALYLRFEGPTASSCYEFLKRAAKKNEWPIPSKRTVERRVRREIPNSIIVLKREGEEALSRLYPYQDRDRTGLSALEWINGDGYKHNVFVRWPGIDEPVRPKTWFWQDVYSNKILAWRTDLTENTDMIRLAFLTLADAWGLPRHATIDNTMAAANKWMSGGTRHRFRFTVREEDPLGVFPACGVTVHWAMPRHGQSKPVERAFGVGLLSEYCDKHPALAGAWCGNNVDAKPENYGSRAVDLETFLKALSEAVGIVNSIEGRRTDVCEGKYSYDQAFFKSYERVEIRRPTLAQRHMMMLCAESVRVARDGSFKIKAGSGFGTGDNRYWCREVVDRHYIGKTIVARFDPQDLHGDVHCFTPDGRFLGMGECQQKAGFGDREAAREHNRARRRYVKAVKESARALVRMDAIEAAKALSNGDAPDPETPEPKVVRVDFRKAPRREAGGDFDTDGAFSRAVALFSDGGK